MQALYSDWALLPHGWRQGVRVCIGDDGKITRTEEGVIPHHGDVVLKHQAMLPALSNVHSHAFQHAMAGLAETRSPEGKDNFWSWREVMYRFVDRLNPQQTEAITAMAFLRMLESGFASVGEFHYLHHQPGGTPYDNPLEMTERIVAAAIQTGIGLTLLPVFYSRGGMDGRALAGGQLRFGNSLDGFLNIHADAVKRASRDMAVGIAPHSLRAVSDTALHQLVKAVPHAVVHIHVAEQQGEVDDVVDFYGMRPVQWLLEHVEVNDRWCLIHATHMNENECMRLASSGAVAGICPMTESNLGDGIFPATAFLAEGGTLGIGTDSNIRISPSEELRALEYSQRLRDEARAVLALPGASTGRTLYELALKGGSQALSRPSGALAAGLYADIVALDLQSPYMAGRSGDFWLDSWIFAADASLVRHVWSAGRHCVIDGRHVQRDTIYEHYQSAMKALLNG